MENETDTASSTQFKFQSWIIAPLAILLSFVVGLVLDIGLETENFWVPAAVLFVAMVTGTLPRFVKDQFSVKSSLVPLIHLILVFGVHIVLVGMGISPVLALMFTVMALGVTYFDSRHRFEESTIVVFTIVGFFFSLLLAGHASSWLPEADTSVLNTTLSMQTQASIAFVFFSSWIASTLVGVIVAILQRGILVPEGEGSWFSHLPKYGEDSYYKTLLPLLVPLIVWVSAHIGTLIHFGLSEPDVRLTGEHATFWWALFTGIVSLAVGFFVAERWFTRAILTSAIWTLYTAGLWQEKEYYASDLLEGNSGIWIWFAITFFVFVGVFYISSHEKYGRWSLRSIGDRGRARMFWGENWSTILTLTALFAALVIRTAWNVLPAMNATGTGNWDMTGGSDPWYMKRVVDYIVAQHAHFVIDADRAYPVGAINPRPPLFAWSLALGGLSLSSLTGMPVDEATWWSVGALPAIYGALIVLPIAAMARTEFGKGAGVAAAWLIAFMPGHVSHSTFGLADHDAFVLLFLSLGFYFYLKAIRHSGDDKILENTSWNPLNFLVGIKGVFGKYPTAMSYAILSGVAIATVALGWKGFVYGPAILFVFFITQVVLNLFRRRDSMAISAITIIMLFTITVLALPYYANAEINLIWDATGFQPMFYIGGFTIITAYLSTSFRDKPWLLVVGTGAIMILGPLFLVWLAWTMGWSDAGSTLFTGGGYFAKNKIFGTIAEAQAPSRGVLFASFGPVVFLSALFGGVILLWNGFRHRKVSNLLLSVWVLIASYMAWSAGRFVFNATPIMAIMGAGALALIWNSSGSKLFSKEWKRMGIGTPGARFKSLRKVSWKHPGVPAMFLVFLLVVGQHAAYGLDAGIPRGSDNVDEVDEEIYNLMPDIFRWDVAGWSLLDNSQYSEGSSWYTGAFGPGFNGYHWNMAYEWLAEQDLVHEGVNDSATCEELDGAWTDEGNFCSMKFGDKPAFVSWWDYGFQALAQGQHPTVADNFQSGIPAAGNMLLSRSQDDVLSLYIWKLLEADFAYNIDRNWHNNLLTPRVRDALENYMTEDQIDELYNTARTLTQQKADDRMLKVVEHTGEHVNNEIYALVTGHPIVDGIVDMDSTVWRLYKSQVQLGSDYDSEELARAAYESLTIGKETFEETSHYIVGDYWYTKDIVEEFNDPGTVIHRQNARLALTRQVLVESLNSEDISDLYTDLSSLRLYEVADSEGLPGQTIVRNNEIGYFAVDNRLYPVGGAYEADSAYNYGNPTGIFYAPTTLSGQDPGHFLNTIYETQRGSEVTIQRTQTEYEDQMRADFLKAQSGGGTDDDGDGMINEDQVNGKDDDGDGLVDEDPVEQIQLVDVRVEQLPAFFDTMIARTYVGYGANSLGLVDEMGNPINAQPAQHFGQSGTPNSEMYYSLPLPGAMMNHLVLANWYESESTGSLGNANTGVKILKYYSGTELCGKVTLDDGNNIPGSTVLIERDAFSGESASDDDNRTYWIPIGTTQADEQGEYCFTVPAGKIRVSAFTGSYNPDSARQTIMMNQLSSTLGDVTVENNDELRVINPVTALLGEVAGMMWLGESQINITGDQANRISGTALPGDLDVNVKVSGLSGDVTWVGNSSFDGTPLVNSELVLENVWNDLTYTTTTIEGEVFDENRTFMGTGEATFTEEGLVESSEPINVTNFTGEYTRTLLDGQKYTGNGTWVGKGTIAASWINDTGIDVPDCTNSSIPDPANNSFCNLGTNSEYLVNGSIMANGQFTVDGALEFTTHLEEATFEGEGKFVGVGTFNGTALYSGTGDYSGEMVKAGTYIFNDIAPGYYNATIKFSDDKSKHVNEEIVVELGPAYGLELTISGLVFSDELALTNGTQVNASITLFDDDLSASNCIDAQNVDGIWLDESGSYILPGSQCIRFDTEEDGTFSYGPLVSGNYSVQADLDGDGWYELNSTLFESGPFLNLVSQSIPIHYDVDIQLANTYYNSTTEQMEAAPVEAITLNFTSVSSPDYTISSTSNATGHLSIELPVDDWIVMGEHNDLMLWTQISVVDSDLASDDVGILSFAKGIEISGSVLSMSGTMLGPVSEVEVEFRNGDIIVYTNTSSDGLFNMTLPEGSQFNVTVDSGEPSHLVDGMLLDVTSDAESVDLILSEPTNVAGYIFINNSATGPIYDSSAPGYTSVEVGATDTDTGVTWYTMTDHNGRYNLILPDGTYSFSVDQNLLNIDGVTYSTSGDNSSWDLIAHPDNITVDVRVFLDTNSDQVFENGTAVNIDFQLQSSIWPTINVTADSYGDSVGELSLDLALGTYLLSLSDQDPNNGTDYQTKLLQQIGDFDIGLEPLDGPIDIVLEPSWLVTGTLTDASSGVLDNHTLTFNLLSTEIYNSIEVETDQNGSIATYIPEGNWSVSTPSFEHEDGTTQQLLVSLIVSHNSSRIDMQWQTLESAWINAQLIEVDGDGDNTIFSGFELIASIDLGDDNINVSVSEANETGFINQSVWPGTWSYLLIHVDMFTGNRWVLDMPNVTLSTGEIWSTDMQLQRETNILGNVYWEINDDDKYTLGGIANEGISDANVVVTGTALDEPLNVTTNYEGAWEFYVPARNNYTLNVTKDGFNYTLLENFTVGNESVGDKYMSGELDIQLTALSVAVSGMVDLPLGAEENSEGILNELTVNLIPFVGYEREAVAAQVTVNGTTANWSAEVTPGEWVIEVKSSSYHLVNYQYFNAGVNDGGVMNVTLVPGGYIALSTEWTDYSGESHSILDTTIENAPALDTFDIAVTFGADTTWNVTFAEEGMDFLLPPGSVQFSGVLITEEMGTSLMYLGDVFGTISEAGPVGNGTWNPVTSAPGNLILNRPASHLLSLNVTSLEIGDTPVVSETLTDVEIGLTDSGYESLIYTIQIDYRGNLEEEVFVANEYLGGFDQDSWTIEYLDNGTWVSDYNLTMGLGSYNDSSSAKLSSALQVKVTPPSFADSRSYEDGHEIVLDFAATTGEQNKISLIIRLPQIYGINVTGQDILGVPQGVSGGKDFFVDIRNVGNGNDELTFTLNEDDVPDGWQITTPVPRTFAANETGVVSFTVVAGTNTNVTEWDLIFTVTGSSDEVWPTSGPLTMTVLIATAELTIEDISAIGGELYIRENAKFEVTVSNNGYLDADNVKLIGRIIDTTVEVNSTTSIAAGGVGTYIIEFDLSEFGIGDYEFEFEIDAGDTPLTDEPLTKKSSYELAARSASDSNQWLPFIIMGFAAMVLTLWWRSRRTKGPGF